MLSLTIPGAFGQKTSKFYDFQWRPSDAAHARFYSEMEYTDSGWHRTDYYLHGPILQMEGWYEDSTCKIATGRFIYFYPDKKLEMTGRYAHNKKEGLWLTFHYNGMMADSTVYAGGKPIGTRMAWHPNGMTSDSAIYQPDGSGVEVTWFDNGNPSSAGRYAPDYKMHGKWQFFHSNGKVSAFEMYDHGKFVDKQYFDETGQPIIDTTTKDRTASFKGGNAGWLKYLNNHLDFPANYQITNSDEAAVIVSGTIDEDGNVRDIYVSTPFYPPFEKIALEVIRRSPKWLPAMEHNRRTKSYFRQPVVFSQPAD